MPTVSPVSSLLTISPINQLKYSLPNSNMCITSMTSTHRDNHLIESGVVSVGFEYTNVSKRKDKMRK